MNADALSTLNTLFGVVGSFAAMVAAVVGLRNRILSRRAAASAKNAEDKSEETKQAVDAAGEALSTATAALNTMRDRYDDLMAAYFQQQTLSDRLRWLERWAAEQENDRHKSAAHAAASPFTEGVPHD